MNAALFRVTICQFINFMSKERRADGVSLNLQDHKLFMQIIQPQELQSANTIIFMNTPVRYNRNARPLEDQIKDQSPAYRVVGSQSCIDRFIQLSKGKDSI